MSRSFAVWGCRDYSSSSGSAYNSDHINFISELHINFWNLSAHKAGYLDFGITFKKPEDNAVANHGAICIFLPFEKESNLFSDLSENLESSRDLVTAVFNEYLIDTKTVDGRHLKLVLANKGELVVNTKLTFSGGELDHRVKVTKIHNGTLIVFKLKDCLSSEETCSHYLRFRIQLNKEDISLLVKTFYPKDLFLKSNIERSDIIDFRLNEQRNLPSEIATTIASAACTPLKCHIFIIRDMIDDCSASGVHYKGSRILESETWKKYFNGNISFGSHDPMIYHWKISNDINSRLNDFSVVVKFKNTKSKLSKIFTYLFYGAALTFVMKFIPTENLNKNLFIFGLLLLITLYIIAHFIKFRK
ncbi:hypothetical protein [Kluyvera sp. CHPC 1.251]|uniref:hypothetical protein n=1 Tax=Kluyvera sp. CHPC 1.251 TaxID=2995175 RepID=UPI002FD7DCB2